MKKQTARKLRPDLTEADKARLEKYASLAFKSIC
jgi:hypothetical protein